MKGYINWPRNENISIAGVIESDAHRKAIEAFSKSEVLTIFRSSEINCTALYRAPIHVLSNAELKNAGMLGQPRVRP